ncbi:serine hydrolase domain-containing protein [Polaribacter sp.]|uniref:serine hydrolase domain-containing protein n=1 Tax=Polaribacter sp. TaxID=1920175 RepID=UPI003F6C498C
MKKTYFLFFLLAFNQFLSAQNLKNDKATSLGENFLKEQNIPGMAISVSKKGSLIYSQGFGYLDIKKRQKVNAAKTKFRIASISKTLTALALGKLVDEGKLKLDHSLYNYVPDFPKKKYDFTVRQLGGHLAGIRHYNGREFLLNKRMSIVEGLDVFKDSKLLFKPQTKFKYSTYGWNLLSVAIQNVSGKDYFKYMQEQIFKPLKMNNTCVDFTDKKINHKTKFYILRGNKIIEGPKVNNEFKAAGGGYLSTSEDLVIFGNEFIYPNIISKKTLQELVTPQKTTSGKNTNYGIGIGFKKINNTIRFSHSGGGIGASTYLLIYPEKEIVISILTNLSGVKMKNLIKGLEKIFLLSH